MKNVLITSGEPRMAYVICKALHKKNFRVYIGDTKKLSMASFSRYSAGSMVYASPGENKERFIHDILNFVEKKRIDILLPTMEEIFVLSDHLCRLQEKVQLLIPGYEQIRIAHNKKNITNIAKRIGIAVPETWEATELLADGQTSTRLPFPVIIKPKEGKGGWGTTRVDTAAELLDVCERTENLSEYIVQRFITGTVVAVCAIYKDGKCFARDSYVAQAVYPLKVGQATIRKSVHFEDTLHSLTTLLDHLEWNGVCEADYIIEDTSGTSYLLDVNPRFWASIAQNIAAGVNYPYYYCELASGNTTITASRAIPDTYTRWISGDMQRIAAEFFISDRKFAYFKQWLTTRRKYAAYDDWDKTDPLPFACWWINAFMRKMRKISAL